MSLRTILGAFEPVLFQEIGPNVTFNANFCRNPMCPHFGPAPPAEAYRALYTVKAVEDRPYDRTYECNFCGMSRPLLSNRSLRAAYVWFKRQSIPLAARPTPGSLQFARMLTEERALDLQDMDVENDTIRLLHGDRSRTAPRSAIRRESRREDRRGQTHRAYG